MSRMRNGMQTRSRSLCGAVAYAVIGWAGAAAADPPSSASNCVAEAAPSAPSVCPSAPLRAADFPMLITGPMTLDSRQFAAESAPVWVVGMQLRRASEPFSGAESYQFTLSQALPRTPLAVSVTTTMTSQAQPPGAEFVRPAAAPVQPAAASITMRLGSASQTQPGWYLFAASNHDALRWSIAETIPGGGGRMGYQGGRVDMGRQVGFGLDLTGRMEGMQLGLVYSQHEIDTRRGGTDEDMVGMTLSRRR